MKKDLLIAPSTLSHAIQQKPLRFLFSLLLLLVFGVTTKTAAQCAGPYARFESFATSGTFAVLNTAAPSFTGSVISFGSSTTNARSGRFFCITTSNGSYLQTPAIDNPQTISLYVRGSNASFNSYTVEYSTDDFATATSISAVPGGVFTLPTMSSTYQLVSVTFSTPLNSSNVKLRIKDTYVRGIASQMYIDDIAWTRYTTAGAVSTGFPENTVVAPIQSGNGAPSVCSPVAAGTTVLVDSGASYNFYDNGGTSDDYNLNQINQVTFRPSATAIAGGYRIRIQFISYTGAASDRIEVFDDTAGAANQLLNHTATTIPAQPYYLSTVSANGELTIKFTSDAATNAAGYNIRVDCVLCAKPTNLLASSVGPTTAYLDWDDMGTSSYEIYYSTSSTTPLSTATPTVPFGTVAGNPFYTLTGLTAGQTYYAWVRSYCSANSYSGWSAVTSFTTVDCSAFVIATSPSTATQSLCLNAPATALSATASGGTVSTYQWYRNASNSNSGGTLLSGANSSSYTPLTTSTGTLYYYCVITSTLSCTVTSAVSGAVIVTTVPTAPGPTAGSSATSSSITANWNASPGATGYSLDVATDNTFTSMVSGSPFTLGNVLTYTVSGLTASTTYYYRVRAINGCGTGTSFGVITYATTAPPVYCTPSGVGFPQDPQGITNVTIGTINNTTGIEATNYGNYTAISTNVFQGATIPFSVTFRTGFTYDTNVWVDWNNDGDFADAGELLFQGNSTNAIPTTVSGSFAVPLLNSDSVSTVGSHRMRIGGIDFGPFSDPCRNGNYQAFEDYTLNVITVPPCAVSTASALTTVNVTGTTASLVWTDSAMTPNTIYNYYISTSNVAPPADGSDPSGMGTVTGALSANVTGLTLGVTYYFWIRSKCNASSYSAWIGSATFTTANLDVVNMTTGSLTSCNAKFYDSGGFGSNYVNNESYVFTFTPSAGNSLKIVFNSFATENNYDGLMIYNGIGTGGTVIPSGLPAGTNATTAPANSYYGNISPGTLFTPVNGSVTFEFKTDGSVVRAGWDATITCVVLPTITSFTPTSTCIGSTPVVTITGTNFTSVTSVKFNGVNAASFTVNSATSITATLPAGATTGYITVTTPEATGTSATVFSVKPIPTTPNAGADVAFCAGQNTTLSAVYTPASNSLATTQLGGNGCGGGNMFNIVTNSSPITITALDITPNITALQNVNVYYKVGTYLGSETTSGAWTLLGTYAVNGVSKVMINMPITNLNLLASTTYGIFVNYDASYTTGINTYFNSDITINMGAGLCGAFTGVNASRTFNGAVYYQLNLPLTYSWTPTTGLSNAAIPNPVATPTSTTTYTVIATSNGCSSPGDSVVVTVNPLPTVSIPTPSSSVCANTVVMVTTTSTATTNTWTSTVANTLFSDATGSTPYVAGTNTATIYVRTPSTATITVTGTNTPSGCSATANVTFSVVVKRYLGSGIWNPAGPPANDGTENFEFFSGTYNSTGNLSGCSCSVTGAAVTMNSGHTMTLLNGLTVSSGSMTFNNNASLVQTNNVANTGNITYKRDTTPIYKFDYTYWSTPVSPQTLFNLSPLSPLFYQYNASVPAWAAVSSSTTMVPGKGYIIRAPSTWPVGPLAPPPVIYTASFIGVPNNGTYTTPIFGTSNQLNLLGNPYPSALSATLFVNDPANSSILDGTLYFWTHNTPINASYQYTGSDYASFNTLGGVGTAATNPGVNMSIPNGKIASGQGFFIKGIANGNATFLNTMRIAGNNDQFYKSNNPVTSSEIAIEKNRFWLDISNTEGAYKQILMGYVAGGTIGLDRNFDGEMVDIGNVITLYTMVADKKLSIQGRGLPFDISDTVPLGYKSLINGTFTIALSDFDGLFDSQNIYLEDTVTGEIHDLKASAYVFTTTIGTFEDRFIARFTTNALGITHFNANSVVVYNNQSGLHISTGNVLMKNVKLYDIAGRLIVSRDNINAAETVFTNLPTTQQVLLVQVITESGEKVTKKVVF